MRRIHKPQIIYKKTQPGDKTNQTTSQFATGQHDFITNLDFSPDGKRVVAISILSSTSSDVDYRDFAPVRCFDVFGGKLRWQVTMADLSSDESMSTNFCDAQFSPDGRTVAAYQFLESCVFLIDATTGDIIKSRRFGTGGASTLFVPPGLIFSPDGRRLYIRGRDRVWFWDWQ